MVRKLMILVGLVAALGSAATNGWAAPVPPCTGCHGLGLAPSNSTLCKVPDNGEFCHRGLNPGGSRTFGVVGPIFSGE